MGFLEVLTLIFVVLKFTGYIDWSWAWVLSPIIVAFSIYLVIIFGFIITYIKSR